MTMTVLMAHPKQLLLGDDPKQQQRASQALFGLVVYLAFAVVQHVEVLLGMIDERDSWPLTVFYLGGGLAFYVAIRLGVNQRVASDRALTMPQALWGMTGAVWSYAITGPARGAILLIMMLVMVFGIFSMTPRQVRLVSVHGFVLLVTVMAWKSLTHQYDPRVEGVHLTFTALTLAAVSALSIRMGAMRTRLERQKVELSAALARIQALATRDELTGLTNRRAALERMRADLAVRGRPDPLMSLALIDIDHFKRVNDTLGHAAGDGVLRRFAELGQSVVRAGDVLARWGGEEFLLVMPATAGPQALAALERLRNHLHLASFDDVAPGLRVTFSAGVAECAGTGDLEAAIERADVAMYRAKNAGRDRTLAAT